MHSTPTDRPASVYAPPHWWHYGIATLLSVVTLLLTLLLEPFFASTPSPLFFAAVALSARIGGIGPALLATLLSALALGTVLLGREGWLAASADTLLHLLAFALVAILIAVLDERRRQAELRATTAASQLRILADASREFSDAVPDWRKTVETVAGQITAALGDSCVLSLLSEDGQRLMPVAWHHGNPDAQLLIGQLYTSVHHGPDEGLSGRVLQTGQPLMLQTVEPADIVAATKSEYRSYLERFPIYSLLVVPLRARGRILGTLALSRTVPDHPYDVADQSLLQDLADRAALSIDNAQLGAYHRTVFEGTAEAMVVADAEGRFVDVNPAAASLLGYSQEELCQLRAEDVVVGGISQVAPAWDRFLQLGSWKAELDLRRKDGGSVPIEVRGTSVALPTGAMYLISWHDVSERQATDRMREAFLASVSHDLKTPLTAAQAALGFLDGSADDRMQDDERQLLTSARRNLQRLGFLIDDLLAHNQLVSGTLELDCEPLDLRTVVTDAVTAVAPLVRRKGQDIEVALPTPLPVDGDPRRLEQVIVNLLANAHEHTPSRTRIVASGRRDGGEVVLTVRDNGPGIPPEDLEAIFRRHRRLGSGGGGVGLGLAIARELAELHGGRVWAENAPGQGASFHVALPVHREGAAPGLGRGASPPPDLDRGQS